MKLQVEVDDGKETFWAVFVHASIDAMERQEQWAELRVRRQSWYERWVLGGAFNDINGDEEKKGGRKKTGEQFLRV